MTHNRTCPWTKPGSATLAADDPAFPRWRLWFRAVWKMAHDLPAHWLAFRPPQEAAVLAAAGDLLALRLPSLSLSCDAPGVQGLPEGGQSGVKGQPVDCTLGGAGEMTVAGEGSAR